MRGLKIFQVDAFTSRPFAGNPAAVVLLDRKRPDEWMQSVASEMNLSETAFVLREGEGAGLRWFTPAVEVDLCGHATLASAHVLYEAGSVKEDRVIPFSTRSGVLKAARKGGFIELDFPGVPAEPAPTPDGLSEALGAKPVHVAKSRFDCLVELEDEDTVRGLAPDIAKLRKVPARGIIVTAKSDTTGFDFVSRFFAPASGIDEDPVTGSAHCTLGPFWAERLGKKELTGFQASKRGGVVRVRLSGGRVMLGGEAVTVFSGELNAG